MTHIECSNITAFLNLIEKLRERGLKVSGAAGDTGMFHIYIE